MTMVVPFYNNLFHILLSPYFRVVLKKSHTQNVCVLYYILCYFITVFTRINFIVNHIVVKY